MNDYLGMAEKVSFDDEVSLFGSVDAFSIRKIANSAETEEMIDLYKQSDDAEVRNCIANSILMSFQGMIRKCAGKFASLGSVSFADLVQAGNNAVIGAIPAFDSSKGARFSTFVYTRIKADVQRCYRKNAFSVARPVNKFDDYYKILGTINDYSKAHGEEPSLEFVSDKLGFSLSKVKNTLNDFTGEISLDATIDEDEEECIIDNISDDCSFEPSEEEKLKTLLKNIKNDEVKHVAMLGLGCDENGNRVGTPLGSNLSAYVNVIGGTRAHVQKLLTQAKADVAAAYNYNYAA